MRATFPSVSTWKPLAWVIGATVLLTVTALAGINHETGAPNGLGYGLIGVIAVVGLWWFRDDL